MVGIERKPRTAKATGGIVAHGIKTIIGAVVGHVLIMGGGGCQGGAGVGTAAKPDIDDGVAKTALAKLGL